MQLTAPALKIGYVLKRYPRFSETFVVNEILALEAAGVNIEIFALGPVQETHFQEVISRVKAPVRRVRHQFNDSMLFWQLLVRARQELPGFRKHADLAEHYDAYTVGQAIVLAMQVVRSGIQHLHAHFGTLAANQARLAAAFAGITYSFTAHAKDIYHQYEEPVELDLKIRDAAFTVTVSDYNLRHLRNTFGATENNSFRIYNGLDLDRFPYQAPTAGKPHIMSVGRLVEKKGLPTLVEAMALLRDRGIDCHCTLIGDGPMRDALTEQINGLGLQDRVSMPGAKAQPEVIDMLRTASVMAVPCIISKGGDRDGLPTILVEAMALGTPCISTAVVGIPELIRHEQTGLCIEPNDPVALADAIAKLLADPAECLRLSRNARQLVESDYDVHRNTIELRDLFRRAIEANARARATDEPANRHTQAGSTEAHTSNGAAAL
ncbi:MAG: glycosyltransferase family 4 protein [Lautropia sp.]|nr:glycosyltransferase family 4 protein [Lautropia sp.]